MIIITVYDLFISTNIITHNLDVFYKKKKSYSHAYKLLDLFDDRYQKKKKKRRLFIVQIYILFLYRSFETVVN